MKPKCSHCGQEFDTWEFAKRHVKYCESGPHPRKRIEDRGERLYCAYCAESESSTVSLREDGTYGFETFKDLGRHVLEEHVLPFAPSARAKEVEKLLKSNLYKEQQMSLPAPTASAKGANNPFLKAEHFNGKGKGTLMLLGGRIPKQGSNSYSDIFVDVTLGRTGYTWGLKADTRNYAALYKRFGSDEKKWRGAVKVEIAKDKFINVVGS